VDAGWTEEALVSKHSSARERLEVGTVAGDDAAPEPDVHVTLASRRSALLLEGVHGGRRGNTVERHVDDRGHTAGLRRARRRREPFPVSSAGLVDVDVGIDEPWQYEPVARVDRADTCEPFAVAVKLDDLPVADVECGGTNATRQYHSLAGD